MKKTLVSLLRGASVGLAIGFTFTVLISTYFNEFAPANITLVNQVGPLKAAQMTYGYSAFIGIMFSLTNGIWKKEDWSLLKQTSVFFIINIAFVMYAGYQLYWFPHNTISILIFIGEFVVVFAVIWLVMYLKIKKETERLNQVVHKKQ